MQDFITKANAFGKKREPFFFLIDFEKKRPVCIPLDQLHDENIFCSLPNWSNKPGQAKKEIEFQITAPLSFEKYKKNFSYAKSQIAMGNSYLLNLTAATKLACQNSLWEIFIASKAPYSLFYQNKFTLFSPECFIKSRDNKIYTYPMKGTIDANLPNAATLLLENNKERWEHNTIVDLLRNDLAMVAKNIEVSRYRFLSRVTSPKGDLLQASSEICGELGGNWQCKIGDILDLLLPAGSISGAPKKKTCEIIATAEKSPRGYFTGVFGVFDGENIESGVNIRYIELKGENIQFRSGGGVTAHSNAKDEYREVLQKVYVPTS